MEKRTLNRRDAIVLGAIGGLALGAVGSGGRAFAQGFSAASSDAVSNAASGSADSAESAANPHQLDYLLLVNAQNALPDWWEQVLEPQLVTVANPIADDSPEQFTLERRTHESFLALRTALLEEEGIQIELDSCLRTVAEQQELVDEWTAFSPDPSIPGEEYVAKYVAKPGTSEHHTGLALDVCLVKDGEVIDDNDRMNNDEQASFDAVHARLADFGFILRFPRGKEHLTGQAYETWHYRYVGSPEVARFIAGNDLTFEEFHGLAGA